MRLRFNITASRPAAKKISAFSVVELLLAVVIMGLITFALYAVFNQTQRAMRSSQTQGDITDRGRAILEMISREVEQAVPTFGAILPPPPKIIDYRTNLVGTLAAEPTVFMDDRDPAIATSRTNLLYSLIFFNRTTNNWNPIGYRIIGTNGVGTLYRYGPYPNATNNSYDGKTLDLRHKYPDPHVFEDFNAAYSLDDFGTNYHNLHYLASGVVHFKFTAYDENGLKLGYNTTNLSPHYTTFRAPPYPSDTIAPGDDATVLLTQAFSPKKGAGVNDATNFAFRSNALPAFLEMELGLLEPETLKQYQVILSDGNATAAANFLTNKINKVHLFRQRIPIRASVQ
jgi:hypothetical protein